MMNNGFVGGVANGNGRRASVGQYTDLWNILSRLTWKRGLNAAKLLGSFYWSRFLGRPVMRGLPMSISLEPTTHCNLRCPHCPSGLRSFTRPTGMVDKALFRSVVDDLQETLLYLLLYFQGEPYLHPEFTELVRYASRSNIYTATSTNGHYLNRENAEKTVQSGLGKLIISIDGMEQKTYEQYRVGGRLQQVMRGIDALIQAKSVAGSETPFIEAQFIVFGHNEHEIPEFRKMCKERGIKAVLKTAQLYEKEGWREYLPTNPKYSRYLHGRNGGQHIKNKLLNHCWKMWHSAVITWDGQVVPCCFDKDASHAMGSVAREGFSAIWTGASYGIFRKALLGNRKNIDICRNCTEGTRVGL